MKHYLEENDGKEWNIMIHVNVRHWADRKEVRQLIEEQRFSEIDLPAVLM